jgi:tetratricopeptide (TPR) repeat protein
MKLPILSFVLVLLTTGMPLSAQTANDFEMTGVEKANKGDLEGAIADFSRAITLAPDFALAYYDRGTARYSKGDLDGAITDLTNAITLVPNHPAAYNNRGIVRDKAGDINGAIADFDRAIALGPDLAEPFHNRGKVKFLKGDLEGAIADFDKAIALNPTYAVAYLGRGVARQTKGDLDGAVSDYDKHIALSKDPAEYARFFRNLAARQSKRTTNDDLAKQVVSWPDGWPKTVGRFLAGAVPEQAFLAQAAEGDTRTVREHQCEAFYYAGMVRLIAGDRVRAKDFFEKCLATQMTRFSEFILARAELTRLAATK